MLAHSGLALITEKLQNQRLEETTPSTCVIQLPQVTQDTSAKAACQQPSLAVKGRNVWTLSLESERQNRHESGTQDTVKSLPWTPEKTHSPHPVMCRHKKLLYSCQVCDSAPGTPAAPPKKKHCRSLSVPPDGLTVMPAVPVREPGGKIWKPIALIPHSNSNVSGNRDTSLLPGTHASESNKWLPKVSSGFKRVPVVSSSPSVDSGRFTNSDFQTPPGSPVPRPASAASDTSFSSLGSVWHDYSPIRSRVRVLENRSLSCEDQICGSSSTNSMPCVHDNINPSSLCCENSSQDSSNICSGIPRCHSQPCVLHHRRCGKKRRRDCDRPTLNFNKMTETAYTRRHQRSESWSTPGSDHQLRLPKHQVFTNIGFGLNPIASSPLDTQLPVVARHLMDSDLSHAASIALPLTPPDHVSPDYLHPIGSRGRDEDNEEDEVEEEEEGADHKDCNCHDSRTDDGVGFFPMNDLDLEEIESH